MSGIGRDTAWKGGGGGMCERANLVMATQVWAGREDGIQLCFEGRPLFIMNPSLGVFHPSSGVFTRRNDGCAGGWLKACLLDIKSFVMDDKRGVS